MQKIKDFIYYTIWLSSRFINLIDYNNWADSKAQSLFDDKLRLGHHALLRIHEQ